EELLCKKILKAISSLMPISKEQHQKLEGQCLWQTKTKDALINLPVRFCKVLELDSTSKICHRCIKFTNNDPDYITNNNDSQATK
ncbi:7721_t:CDS:2, partial [Cetraspora pellucida]